MPPFNNQPPRFPEDFKVLYAEGASYYWWSPHTGPDFDGTVPMDQEYPFGIVIGDEATNAHVLVPGEPMMAVWTNFSLDEEEVFITETYDPTDPTCVQRLIEEVISTVESLPVPS